MKIKRGMYGTIINPDNRAAAELLKGAKVRVRKVLHFPDGVEVEFLDSGPNWRRGESGELPVRYFSPRKARR